MKTAIQILVGFVLAQAITTGFCISELRARIKALEQTAKTPEKP